MNVFAIGSFVLEESGMIKHENNKVKTGNFATQTTGIQKSVDGEATFLCNFAYVS